MDELFCRLEKQLKLLIQKYQSLKTVTVDLQHDQSILMRDKELLLAKNKLAILQIENMVTRLKSIEKIS
jgi:uncharacterized protein (TIGR02449 family)